MLLFLADRTEQAELPQPRYHSLGVFKITAYCKCKKCCGRWAKYHTTTGGVNVYHWKPVVAVDPKLIRLNTPLYIDGIGPRLASDTGPKIKGHKIDLLVVGHQRAVRFGNKWREVWVVQQVKK